MVYIERMAKRSQAALLLFTLSLLLAGIGLSGMLLEFITGLGSMGVSLLFAFLGFAAAATVVWLAQGPRLPVGVTERVIRQRKRLLARYN